MNIFKILAILWHNIMRDSSLVQILKSFSRKEFSEFGKFVRSPYFNNRSEVVRFFEAVKKYYPSFTSKDFSKENLFALIYEGKKYKDVLFRKLVSLLSNHALDFIATARFRSGQLDYRTRLLEELSKRKLDSLFKKHSVRTESLLSSTQHNSYYHYYKYRYSGLLSTHYINKDIMRVKENFQAEADNFFEYFLAESLQIYGRLKNLSVVFNKKYDLKFYDEVLNHLKSHEYGSSPVILIYYKILLLVNTNSEKYFYELKQIHKEYETKLDRLDEYNLFTVLFNYCIDRIQKGGIQFRYERFELDKKFISKNLIQLGDYIELYSFLNAVTNAAYINEFKWAEDFVNRYADKLNPKHVDEVKNLSCAFIEFCKGNYETALRHLNKINLELCHLKIDVRNLQTRIYFELGYFEELISLIDAYKHYLKRDRNLTPQTRRINTDFVNFTSKLLKIYMSANVKEAGTLKKQVEKAGYFRFKEWIIQKLDLMKQNLITP